MGKIWMPGGGGGADLDVITASAGDVLSGKVIVDKDGEPLAGTLALSGTAADSQVLSGQTYYNTDAKTKRTGSMTNRGAVSQSLAINGTYTIPAGYHNGSGKVTQSIPTQGAATITPGTSAKTAIAAGRYASGNITVEGNANLVASNIKKGVTIFGVTGTMEPLLTPSVLINGSTVNVEWGYSGAADLGVSDAHGITLRVPGNNRSKFRITTALNLTGWNFLKVYASALYKFYVYDSISSWNTVSSNAIDCAGTNQAAVLDIRSINGLKFLQLDQFGVYNTTTDFYVKKVELTSV